MQCTKTHPLFIPALGILNAIAVSLLLGGLLLIPLLILHILVFALFNIPINTSFVLGFYISLALLYVVLPIYLYFNVKKSYQGVNYEFCDNGFLVDGKHYEYKEVESVEVLTSPLQKFFNLKTLAITTQDEIGEKLFLLKDIKDPEVLVNRVACPVNYEAAVSI